MADLTNVRSERAMTALPLLSALPNALSLARLALGLGFPFLPDQWRLVIIVLAALTDLTDGLLSRLLRATSPVGRLLDPIADKAFVIAVVLTLIFDEWLKVWEAVLLGLRDLATLAGVGWFLVRRDWLAFRRIVPTFLGKATTAAQFVFLVALLFYKEPVLLIFVPTVVLSGLAAADYLRLFLFQHKSAPDERSATGIG